jgi:hypothetical protein
MLCLTRLASDRFRFDQTAWTGVQLTGVRRELEERQPAAGRDQLAHRAADVGVQVVPGQDDGTAELLVRGVQEPGVVRLGEAFAPVVAVPAAGAGAVDQPGPQPGRVAISAASDTRVLGPPAARTTRVWPRRPQVRPLGGLRPWPDSSWKQSQAPRSAAALI